MIQLRPYQQESVYKLIPAAFKAGNKRIIRTAPTGSGKGLEMAELTKLTYEKGNRVLLLTHRKEILKDVLAHIGKQNIPIADLSAGGKMPQGDWRCLMAMEKTLWNIIRKNPDSILRPDLLIVDEGHFNHFTKIINHFSDSFVITFTATPVGKHIPKLYTEIIDNIGIPELIDQNFLTPCKPYMMKDDASLFDKVKKTGDDFDSNALFKIYNTAKRYKGVLDEYTAKVKGKKGIIFCVNVSHAMETYKVFKEAGVNAFIVHSPTKEYKISDQQRDNNIKLFEESQDGVMVNCGILTTGYSHDPIEFGIIDRATTSISLWLQMQGRCSRKHPGKKFFTILDFGLNHERLGLWNQKREWSLVEKKKNKKLGASPVKTCPSCGAMLSARIFQCEFCQYEFERPTSELLNGVMVEVQTMIPLGCKGKRVSELSIQDISNLQRTKKYKSTYCWRIVRSRGREAIKEYANIFGYKNGWVFSQNQKMDDSKFSDYIIK